ncbi:acyl-CoA dehydrogenase family protein [Pseudonocardia sp. GCM10023141]|uniref:acyl-CoA dehydrogenase family protein n=1 Tax=Pseudonocardia sp. GCM10023141 TaxID=3252653 RepID=UPI00361E1601
MDFGHSPEQRAVQDVARRLADRLAPGYVERDIAGLFPWKELAMLGEASLLGLNVPEEAGGQGAGELITGMVCEIIATADYDVASCIWQAGSTAKLLHRHGSAEVRDRWLQPVLAGQAMAGFAFTEPGAGSDISAAVATRARRDGSDWVLDGEKNSMSFAESQLAIVLAGTVDGPAVFCVPTDAPGVTVAPYDDLGGRQNGRAVVTFDGARVPDSARLGDPGHGVGQVLGVLGTSKVLVSAGAIGAATAALRDALAWAQERSTYGATLSTRQGVMFPLVDLSTELEAARLLLHRTLWLADNGQPYRKDAAMVKAWVPALCTRICMQAMLTVGHVGFSREHPAQVRLRDVMVTEFGEGTANVQRLIVAREMTGISPN